MLVISRGLFGKQVKREISGKCKYAYPNLPCLNLLLTKKAGDPT
jgi:hypothetical protein